MNNKILLIDDEETIRDLFSDYLAEDGFLVKVASSGKEAIEIVKKEKFDLFLVDMVMPEMDGFEILQEIRKLNIDTKAFLLTAYGERFDETKKAELKIIDVISKGIPMSEVSKKMRDLLKGG